MKKVALLGMAALFPIMAHAATTPYSATLVKAVDTTQDFVAGDTSWHCEGSTCVSRSSPEIASTVHACHKLVEKVGAVSAYASSTRALDAGALARCNE
jgi:hypothetical protein